jgi:hypothetical protein
LPQVFLISKYLTMNIYVSNLGFGVQDEDLKKIFISYGTVNSAKVIMDKFSNQSKGFGFVEMPDNEAAQKAIKELDGIAGAERRQRRVERGQYPVGGAERAIGLRHVDTALQVHNSVRNSCGSCALVQPPARHLWRKISRAQHAASGVENCRDTS